MIPGIVASAAVAVVTNIVVNGTFDTDTNWTKGSGWSIASGAANKAANDIGSAITNSATVTSGATYRVEFTIVSGTATVTPRLGSQLGTTRSGAGTYVENIVANGTSIDFVSGNNFAVSIDNVSVTAV